MVESQVPFEEAPPERHGHLRGRGGGGGGDLVNGVRGEVGRMGEKGAKP